MTILMASSKTFLSPLWLRAEHSRNFLHRIFLCCRDFTRLLAWTKQDMIHHHMIILRSKGVGWGNLSKCPHLRVGDHLLVLLLELLDLLGVVPEVRLGAHQQYRGVRAVVRHLVRRVVKLLLTRMQLHEVLLTALQETILLPLESTWIQHCQNWWDWSGRNTPEICPETSINLHSIFSGCWSKSK